MVTLAYLHMLKGSPGGVSLLTKEYAQDAWSFVPHVKFVGILR